MPPNQYPPQNRGPQTQYPPQNNPNMPPNFNPNMPPQNNPNMPQNFNPNMPPNFNPNMPPQNNPNMPPNQYPPQNRGPQTQYPPQTQYNPNTPPPQNVNVNVQYNSNIPPPTTTTTTVIQTEVVPQNISWNITEHCEKEPMLLLDTTGSMNLATSETDPTPRCETIQTAIGYIVEILARADSQGKKERGGGGLLTITFAGGHAHNLDDLNPKNLKKKWNKIHWDGGTFICPGWHKLNHVYKHEFGKRSMEKRPLMMVLVITDGEAVDTEEFALELQQINQKTYVTLAIIGYGLEHDKAFNTYQVVAARNPDHIKVISLTGYSDPRAIAQTLLSMIR